MGGPSTEIPVDASGNANNTISANQSYSTNFSFPKNLTLGGATAGIPADAGGNANYTISLTNQIQLSSITQV